MYYEQTRFFPIDNYKPFRTIYASEFYGNHDGDWTIAPTSDARMQTPDERAYETIQIDSSVPVCVDIEHLLKKPKDALGINHKHNYLERSLPILNDVIKEVKARHDGPVGQWDHFLQYKYWMLQDKNDLKYQRLVEVNNKINEELNTDIIIQSAYFYGYGNMREYLYWEFETRRVLEFAEMAGKEIFIYVSPQSFVSNQLVELDLWKRMMDYLSSYNTILWKSYSFQDLPDEYLL